MFHTFFRPIFYILFFFILLAFFTPNIEGNIFLNSSLLESKPYLFTKAKSNHVKVLNLLIFNIHDMNIFAELSIHI